MALACLVIAKLANVAVPLVMKEVVDNLDPSLQIVAVPVALLAVYGCCGSQPPFSRNCAMSSSCVSRRAMRRVALGVFRHLHSLSLRTSSARRVA